MKNARVLLVVDDATARAALAQFLREQGYAVETAHNGFRALATEPAFQPAVVLTNLEMPGMDGFELLRRLRARGSEAGVLLMTRSGQMSLAVRALRAGAADCLAKPLLREHLLRSLQYATESIGLKRETSERRAQFELQEAAGFENMIGSSVAMQRVFHALKQVAPSRATVLLTGESGTGKELAAAAIHRCSQRSEGPFVKVHCAALAPSLLESELFGHERGAYTGAARRRLGRFESAQRGTLFLDEIGEIAPSVQTKLLRVLQERAFERVGGNETLHVDVRLIAATNRDLAAMVIAGQFREDLFYRLNVVGIELPPLRDRSSDIPALAARALEKFATLSGGLTAGISDEALTLISSYQWPGNVRELENTIERALVFSEGGTIEAEHLPPALRAAKNAPQGPCIPGASLKEIERHAILTTLESTGGSTVKAAQILGVSVRMIQYRIQQYAAAPDGQAPELKRARADPGRPHRHTRSNTNSGAGSLASNASGAD